MGSPSCPSLCLVILGNCCFTLQDIVMDFLLDSKVLTQPGLIITRVNLRRLCDKISDLSSYCLPLVSVEGLSGLALLSSWLVAQFSPSGMWNTRTFSSWNESPAVFTVGVFCYFQLLPYMLAMRTAWWPSASTRTSRLSPLTKKFSLSFSIMVGSLCLLIS